MHAALAAGAGSEPSAGQSDDDGGPGRRLGSSGRQARSTRVRNAAAGATDTVASGRAARPGICWPLSSSANVRAIRKYLPLSDEKRAQGHARAEAFYRVQVGQAVSGSYNSRFQMENEAWWDDAEEWLYHFSHITPGQAAISFTTLFFDAYWWCASFAKGARIGVGRDRRQADRLSV